MSFIQQTVIVHRKDEESFPKIIVKVKGQVHIIQSFYSNVFDNVTQRLTIKDVVNLTEMN